MKFSVITDDELENAGWPDPLVIVTVPDTDVIATSPR
jgi:hypothetical protein